MRVVAAFNDGSVLLVGTTEGSWAGDNLGGRDFAVLKLSASEDPERFWQVITGEYFISLPMATVGKANNSLAKLPRPQLR